MFPFVNGFSQQILAEMYASSAHYSNEYYYMQGDALPFWPFIKVEETLNNSVQPSLQDAQALIKEEKPTRGSTKQSRPRQEAPGESQVSCVSGDESSQMNLNFKLRQKYGRNINSNIFHHMIKRISLEESYSVIIDLIIYRFDIPILASQFMDMLNNKIAKLRTYISMKKMRQLLCFPKPRYSMTLNIIEKEKHFSKVFRILCRYYLKSIHLTHIFNALKIQHQSKKLHLAGVRRLLQLMKS